MEKNIGFTDKVETRQDFIKFLNDLLIDFQVNKDKWGNKDLESFLEALSRYTEDIDGFYSNTTQKINADKASWKIFADMFMGAKLYE